MSLTAETLYWLNDTLELHLEEEAHWPVFFIHILTGVIKNYRYSDRLTEMIQ